MAWRQLADGVHEVGGGARAAAGATVVAPPARALVLINPATAGCHAGTRKGGACLSASSRPAQSSCRRRCHTPWCRRHRRRLPSSSGPTALSALPRAAACAPSACLAQRRRTEHIAGASLAAVQGPRQAQGAAAAGGAAAGEGCLVLLDSADGLAAAEAARARAARRAAAAAQQAAGEGAPPRSARRGWGWRRQRARRPALQNPSTLKPSDLPAFDCSERQLRHLDAPRRAASGTSRDRPAPPPRHRHRPARGASSASSAAPSQTPPARRGPPGSGAFASRDRITRQWRIAASTTGRVPGQVAQPCPAT